MIIGVHVGSGRDCHRFLISSHTSDFKNGTLVAILPVVGQVGPVSDDVWERKLIRLSTFVSLWQHYSCLSRYL